jgi:hypothetical protein
MPGDQREDTFWEQWPLTTRHIDLCCTEKSYMKVWNRSRCTDKLLVLLVFREASLPWGRFVSTIVEYRDENGFGIFRNSGNRFRNFSIGFTGNGIFRKRNRFRNFLSESVSESTWCFTDRFHRLPVFVGNYRICVSEISRIVSRNFFRIFFRNFPACDFFASPVHFWIRIAYFCIFWTL